MKLGRRLNLVTRNVADATDECYLSVDWDAFADDEAYLDEIPIPWGVRPADAFTRGGDVALTWRKRIGLYDDNASPGRDAFPSPLSGTIMEMEGLRTAWNENILEDVHRSLSRLISPAADDLLQRSSRDFRILLDLPPRLGSYSGWVGAPDELSRPHYRLLASVDAGGTARITMRLRGEGESRPTIQAQLRGVGGRIPVCGPFTFNLRVWDRDREGLQEVAPGTPFQDFRQLLNQAAGVSMYRDGFRVLPYGELGDDWLALDRRRINDPTKRLSNNQVIGAVNITRDMNPLLVDQTNREGLVEGSALDDLRQLVKELILQVENARYEVRPRDPKRVPSRVNPLESFQLTELRDAVAARADNQLLALVTDTQERLDEHSSEVKEVVARYQRLATLGQLVDRMIHEVAQPALAVRQAAVAGLEIIEDSQTSAQPRPSECQTLLEELEVEFKVAKSQARVVSDVLQRLAPFGGRRRGRPHLVVVEEAMRDVCRILEGDIKAHGIEITLPAGETVVTVDGTELQEILLNLIANSLYWVGRARAGHVGTVAVRMSRESDGSLSIYVSDNGPGVPEPDRERIFEPYFTTREGGVGLGLTIAGQIIEDYYGGSLALISPGELGGQLLGRI